MALPEGLVEGRGCPSCDNTGYSGRTLINEIISVTEDWEDLISRGENPGGFEKLCPKQKESLSP